MKTFLSLVCVLVACTSWSQNAKDTVINFALTARGQASVSDSRTLPNAGTWEAGPLYYKTAQSKVASVNVIQAIAKVLYKNPGFYSSKAVLVLSQSELGGFFNEGMDLAGQHFPSNAVPVSRPGGEYGATSFGSTTDGLVTHLASGRHFLANPSTGAWPVGHHQPWGQVMVKDPVKGLCDNVSFFFSLWVEECYDCFYLSSFLSDTTFSVKSGGVVGPPCCGTSSSLLGSGKDYYYLHLFFDNTSNNPYLRPDSPGYVGWEGGRYQGIEGSDMVGNALPADGDTPDLLEYDSRIASGLGVFQKYVMRFALHGLMTYQWGLKFVNGSDVLPDFVGRGQWTGTGYGFVSLVCQLLSGTVTITEAAKPVASCCLDLPWYDNWYGTGWNEFQSAWDSFGTDAGLGVAGFGSPINTPVDLTFHFPFDELYQPGVQWATDPGPDDLLPTTDAANPDSFVPVGRPEL